jgi:two-component system cell cycle response regulator DivK
MGPTVLVVEDNELNRKLFVHVLGLAGFAVIEAADGTGGLAGARESRPDIILLDMDLPGVPGLEVVRRLRNDPAVAPIPVLAVSALVSWRTEARARALGCIGYLTKPVRPAQLVEAVRAGLAGGRVPARAGEA